jgi:hypothetical protein
LKSHDDEGLLLARKPDGNDIIEEELGWPLISPNLLEYEVMSPHTDQFPRGVKCGGPLLLRNHVLSGQKFHPRIPYPEVLAFEPAYLLSDSLFQSFTIL